MIAAGQLIELNHGWVVEDDGIAWLGRVPRLIDTLARATGHGIQQA